MTTRAEQGYVYRVVERMSQSDTLNPHYLVSEAKRHGGVFSDVVPDALDLCLCWTIKGAPPVATLWRHLEEGTCAVALAAATWLRTERLK